MDECARFLMYCDEAATGCWEWQGHLQQSGYGVFYRRGVGHELAHRAAMRLLTDLNIQGFVVDHLCRNRRCVNPDHLEVTTIAENVMRGVSPVAANRRKETCPLGHPYDITRVSGGRACRQCKNAVYRQWWAERKATR